MSIAYHRMKMKLTHTTVEYVRNFCDGVNVVMASVMLPFQRLGRRINAEAPWIVFASACTISMAVPLMVYPYVKPYIAHDERSEQEEERVRLCLQKGIDPYPYMQFKSSIYGNTIPLFASESEYPKGAAWEWALMDHHEAKKEALRAEVGGDVNASVERLLAMREQKRRDYAALRGTQLKEPVGLTFPGRADVDRLTS